MRIVYIANRLPFKITEEESGYSFKPSPGGLASGLSSYIQTLSQEHLWIGWPGIQVAPTKQRGLEKMLVKEKDAYPIFLTKEMTEGYYNGFCNKVIWPLFHYFTNLVTPTHEYWQNYVEVNEHFAAKIGPLLRDDDLIGIHDYQLMLLPQLLRKYNKNLSISFFLHIPFPSLDVFRMLPQRWRTDLLEGILGSDLIGFHTHEYRQNFLNTALRLLGAENSMGDMIWGNRQIRADVFPMGIDVKKYEKEAKSTKVKQEVRKIRQGIGKQKIIFSVDRLDYTKGIAKRLLGFEEFLRLHPRWHGKVTLVVSSEPSRSEIDQYKSMKRTIDELVGRINGLYGSLTWQPIIYQYTSLSFTQMVALYKASDVALITPLRDGMNLVAKEYIASRGGGKGVLILSEMAGAAKELSESVLINPFDTEEIASGIYSALTLPQNEQERRNKIMLGRLKQYDIFRWAQDINNTLLTIKREQDIRKAVYMTERIKQKLTDSYQNSSQRLIFLDYDGSLAPYASIPSKAQPTKEITERVQRLVDDHRNEVVLISGRDKSTLESWFQIKNLALVAEHGVYKKDRTEYYWSMLGRYSNAWKPSIIAFLKRWIDRLPGSLIEEKEYSIAWHYRQADPAAAAIVMREILYELITYTSTIEIEVIHGNKIIEIKNIGADKGSAAQLWLQKKKYDFVLAVGDDRTDEDLFSVLPEGSHSIKVGKVVSMAKYRLEDNKAVASLLDGFLESKKLGEDEISVRQPQPIMEVMLL